VVGPSLDDSLDLRPFFSSVPPPILSFQMNEQVLQLSTFFNFTGAFFEEKKRKGNMTVMECVFLGMQALELLEDVTVILAFEVVIHFSIKIVGAHWGPWLS